MSPAVDGSTGRGAGSAGVAQRVHRGLNVGQQLYRMLVDGRRLNGYQGPGWHHGLWTTGPVKNLDTGSDLPLGRRSTPWTVDPLAVRPHYRDLFCTAQSSVVKVPGLGWVPFFDLAPLIQRTGEPPRRPEEAIGWLWCCAWNCRMFGAP